MNIYRRMYCPRRLACLVMSAASLANVASAAEPYVVGVAAVDITPAYPVRLNGFGFRRTESEGVTQPIWAKGIAIGADAQKPLILITVDSLGLRLSMVEAVAERLSARPGSNANGLSSRLRIHTQRRK